jgi:predicted nucleic-acid-binding protein
MTAVDTNVLVRVITRDDKAQAARAVAFLKEQERVFFAKTVLLEVEWVLRSTYKFTRSEVLSGLRSIVSVHNVEVEDEAVVEQALSWYEQGIDFADSLHVASVGTQRFVTFDTALQRRARRLGAGKIALL